MTTRLLFILCLYLINECAGKAGTLRFLVVGDCGGTDHHPYTTPREIGNAHRMAQISRDMGADFIVNVGDNFYYHGVRNIHDHRFKDTFENVYTQSSLHIPWYIIAGNHDHRGNVSAEIAYSKVSHRWNFPYYYYPLTFKIPGTNATLDLVMMDTITLCGHSADETEEPPTGPEDVDDANAQWNFITNKMATSRATYLWTIGHYPIYSISSHGPTSCLIHGLLPLLHKYKANGHMSGHDHNLQHFRESDMGHTVDMVVSGSGSHLNPSKHHLHSVPLGSSKFFWADTHTDGGFVYVSATAQQMDLTYLDSMGRVLHRFTSYPRH